MVEMRLSVWSADLPVAIIGEFLVSCKSFESEVTVLKILDEAVLPTDNYLCIIWANVVVNCPVPGIFQGILQIIRLLEVEPKLRRDPEVEPETDGSIHC